MEVNKIAQKARKSISSFCIEECKAYCCRKGYLNITLRELQTLISNKEVTLLPINIKIQENKSYSVFLGDPINPCPCLGIDHCCSIHKKHTRPKMCKEFPIWIDEERKLLLISGRCLAIKQEKLYSHISQILAQGYRLVRGDSTYDSDFFEKVNSK